MTIIRTSGKLAAAAAAAALTLTGVNAGMALADTPPSGCGFHHIDNHSYSSAWFNNCSYYPMNVHVDVALGKDRDVCVKRKSDTFLGEYGQSIGEVRNAWSTYQCGAA